MSISARSLLFPVRLILFSGEVLLLSPDGLGLWLGLVLLGTRHTSQVPKVFLIPSVPHSRLGHLRFGNQLAPSSLIERKWVDTPEPQQMNDQGLLSSR